MATAPVILPEVVTTRWLGLLKPGWRREGGAIIREFVLGGFTEAAQFVAKTAALV